VSINDFDPEQPGRSKRAAANFNPQGETHMPFRKVGVDLGLCGPHHISVCDEAGHFVRPPLYVGTSAQEFDRIYAHALEGASEGTRLKIIFEPTALLWLPFALYTRAKGHLVYRVKTQQLHDLREFYNRYRKNDRLDCKAGAKMPDETLEELYLPRRDYMALDRTTQQHEKLTEHLQREKARLESLLEGLMPGVTKALGEPFCQPARVIYEHLANPFAIQALGRDGLEQLINQRCREKIKTKKLEAIWRCVQNACELYQYGHDVVDFEQFGREIKRYYQHLVAIENLLAEVEAEIQLYYQRVHPSRNIETIYGIGKNLGPVFVAIIKDPNRFRSHTQIKSFIGMIPKIDESSGSAKKGLPITKAGPPRARRAGYIASNVGRRWDPQLAKIYYDAMVYKGHTHIEAVCVLINHMYMRALRVLKEDRPYVLRDLQGNPISPQAAREFIKEHLTVPEEIRRQRRNKKRIQENLRRRRRKNRHNRRNEL
jgi:transposase